MQQGTAEFGKRARKYVWCFEKKKKTKSILGKQRCNVSDRIIVAFNGEETSVASNADGKKMSQYMNASAAMVEDAEDTETIDALRDTVSSLSRDLRESKRQAWRYQGEVEV
jgi:hypothetical protein